MRPIIPVWFAWLIFVGAFTLMLPVWGWLYGNMPWVQ